MLGQMLKLSEKWPNNLQLFQTLVPPSHRQIIAVHLISKYAHISVPKNGAHLLLLKDKYSPQ